MANQEQLDRLQQGVEKWNTWRTQHEEIDVDLSGAKLGGAKLGGAKLGGADLSRSNFSGADLSGADLSRADLSRAHLRETNLRNANLIIASLNNVDLIRANLVSAFLSGADLANALLSGADLRGAILNGADLRGAILNGATIGRTIFGNIDLRMVKGLETVIHRGPSEISTSTLSRSQGHIPKAFLRGVGLDDPTINFARALINNSMEYYTCFISYSSKDQAFAEQLHTNLQNEGIRCWFAPEGVKISEKFKQRIDESIRQYDKLLLVLSEHSVTSQWIENEVETAFKKEHQYNAQALFPIKLDEAVMQISKAWAANLRRERDTVDFVYWKERDEFFKSFKQLIRDLKANPSAR